MEHIHNIAEICHRLGVVHVILSPGSRCAPLTLAFLRHGKFEVKTISDERSAAFIALGMAMENNHPVVLVCTSGSAVYNYAPAVAEAYFAAVPLLVLTADRPEEWIGQRDGQTIFQNNIFGDHVKRSFTYPVEDGNSDTIWHGQRLVSEAVNLCVAEPKGPIHINIPLREPLYPNTDAAFAYSDGLKVVYSVEADPTLSEESVRVLNNELLGYKKVLLIAGQGSRNEAIEKALVDFCQHHKVPLVADVISNAHGIAGAIQHHDLFLANNTSEAIQPDLILSFGQSVVSKNLKLFLRQSDADHWHIQEAGQAADPFQKLSKTIWASTSDFFTRIQLNGAEAQENFKSHWEELKKRTAAVLEKNQGQELTEINVYQTVLKRIPEHTDVHLANSMAVRYANFLGLQHGANTIQFFCNRGTSGIDGSTSTALGTCLSSKRNTWLLTGDMAFFYDRNAFWNNYVPDSFAVVLFNNNGGGIFNMIPGPAKQPEGKAYFVTEQKLNAKHLSEEHGLAYFRVNQWSELEEQWNSFAACKTKKIIEIVTDVEGNTLALNQLKQKIKSLNTQYNEQQ